MTSRTPSGRSGAAQKVGTKASQAGNQAANAGRDVQDSRSFGVLVMVGLLAYGVVHLIVAWLALQIAFTGTHKQASQQGAMTQLASTGVGKLLLWVIAVGLFALAVWQGLVAAIGYRDEDGSTKVKRRLSAGAKAVIYAALGVSAVKTLLGNASSGNKEKSLTAKLMSAPFGRILVGVVALVILVLAGRLIYRGVKKKFLKDLQGGASPGVERLGQIGYCAKGVAMAIVGILFGWATVTFDPKKAGGLDTALRTLRDQAFGVVLLTAVALGIACFGLYCFYWARHAKR